MQWQDDIIPGLREEANCEVSVRSEKLLWWRGRPGEISGGRIQFSDQQGWGLGLFSE